MTDSDRLTETMVGERSVVVSDDTTPQTRELDHAAVRDLLSEYLEGTLEAPLQEDVRQHLDRCPSCGAFLRTFERTIDLVGQLPSPQLPDRTKRRIIDRLTTTADRRPGG